MKRIILALLISMQMSVAFADKTESDADAQAKALGQATKRNPGVGRRNKHPDAQWFPEAGTGLFIHWGIASVWGEGHISWGTLYKHGFTGGTITPNKYYALAKTWNPDKMDFDKMFKAAKAAGFKYVVFTTKHHDGFTHWPSEPGPSRTLGKLG